MHKAHLYVFDDMDSLTDDFVESNRHRLPLFRREQCARYRRVSDQNANLLAYLLLMQGLREQYHITEPVSFHYGTHGKPYLREHPGIFFNLSHCKAGVVCALSTVEIGVDIQDIRSVDTAVLQRVCNEKEQKQLAASADPERLFIRLWTQKESYAKAKGVSVASVLKTALPPEIFHSWQLPAYSLTLCHMGAVDTCIFPPLRLEILTECGLKGESGHR